MTRIYGLLSLSRLVWLVLALLFAPVSPVSAEDAALNRVADQISVSHQATMLSEVQKALKARMRQAQQDVDIIANEVLRGTRDPIRIATLKADLDNVLQRDPDVLDATVLTCDEWLRGEVRSGTGALSIVHDYADQHALVRSIYDPDLLRDTTDAYWGAAAFTALDRPSLTVRERLIYHGAPRGLLIATLDLQPLLELLRVTAAPESFAFIAIGPKLYTKPVSAAAPVDQLSSALAQANGAIPPSDALAQVIRISGKTYRVLSLTDAHCCDQILRIGIAINVDHGAAPQSAMSDGTLETKF